MQVAAVHEVEDEAELVRGVEGVRHTDDEGAVVAWTGSNVQTRGV